MCHISCITTALEPSAGAIRRAAICRTELISYHIKANWVLYVNSETKPNIITNSKFAWKSVRANFWVFHFFWQRIQAMSIFHWVLESYKIPANPKNFMILAKLTVEILKHNQILYKSKHAILHRNYTLLYMHECTKLPVPPPKNR